MTGHMSYKEFFSELSSYIRGYTIWFSLIYAYIYEFYRLVNNQEFIPTLSRSLHFSPSVTFTPCFIQQLESYIFLSLVSVYHISVKEFIFLFWSQYTIYCCGELFFSHVSLLFVVENYFSLKVLGVFILSPMYVRVYMSVMC